MAEVTTSAGADRHKGFARAKKLSTRVDMTPMVDLGFLLITFFILTYHISEPNTMKLILPADGGEMNLGESDALTVIPVANDKLFYYHGEFGAAVATRSYGYTNYLISGGLGDIIRAKQAALDIRKSGTSKNLMLIIKPSNDSRFENLVNTLDELLINNVTRHAIVDVSVAERQFLLQSFR